MDTTVILSHPEIDGLGLEIVKSKREIKKGIKQNFKFLRLVNPFFSCKDEKEYAEYKAQLHKLLDETITARLALFTRVRSKK